ncbi:GyrI-like domain-containing protein [Shewanella sp. 202IG2-18]|uniref:AraC family transcriptional regulator n=1 Tax=Parashewanella hymeniacidonis TaxID=2807618 RepID=UPI00196119D5|nr:GyrI-like domain-containing protein [Parashewanella hymeniacidonis]MBM7072746.1 GyrI-like domain-containing protein [Parashewanella hymeniacidonis]
MEVEIVNLEEESIAFIPHEGEPADVGDTAIKFDLWRFETGYSPIKESNSYGIFVTDPDEVGDKGFRFDIGGSVSHAVPENYYDVRNGVIAGGRYAKARHTGSYETLSKTFREFIDDWLPASGESRTEEPCFFHYVVLPGAVQHVDDIVTDIYVPLKAIEEIT